MNPADLSREEILSEELRRRMSQKPDNPFDLICAIFFPKQWERILRTQQIDYPPPQFMSEEDLRHQLAFIKLTFNDGCGRDWTASSHVDGMIRALEKIEATKKKLSSVLGEQSKEKTQ